MRFAAPVEAEYLRAHLLRSRTLIQILSIAALVLVLLRGAMQFAFGVWVQTPADTFAHMVYAVAAISSAALVWLAWSSGFERFYPAVAPVLVPCRSAIVAVQIARMAAHGQLDLLMVMPALLIGPFFFLGLRFRAALAAALIASVAFVLSAVHYHLPLLPQLRCDTFLLLTVSACAIAARRLDGCVRIWFLENHVICELAEHDALTGAKNRRVFDDYLGRLWQQAIRDDRTLAILLLDVDHFKRYNDRYGHQAGDEVLRQVATTVQALVKRPLDMLARYGGEEFAVILYDVDRAHVRHIAEHIRCAIAGLRVGPQARASAVTVSLGVAVIQPTAARNCHGAVQLADEALYEAKRQGRNRVVLMDDSQHRLLITGMFATPTLDGMAPETAQ